MLNRLARFSENYWSIFVVYIAGMVYMWMPGNQTNSSIDYRVTATVTMLAVWLYFFAREHNRKHE